MNINHVWLRVGERFVFFFFFSLRRSCDFREADLAFARWRVAPTFQRNAPASASEGVHSAGLGDNYSRDHLFPGMRYGNKRSRWRK